MDVRVDLTATHREAVTAMISVFVGWVCLHFSSGLLRVLAKCADDANQLYGSLLSHMWWKFFFWLKHLSHVVLLGS